MADGDLVLIADDEAHIVRALSFILTTAGYRVCTARDGAEAMERIRADRPRLAFLDIGLLECAGCEICRRVKEAPEISDTRIILIGAKGHKIAESDAAGADALLTTPLSPTAALQHVQRLLAP